MTLGLGMVVVSGECGPNTTNTAVLAPGRVFYGCGCAAKAPRYGAG